MPPTSAQMFDHALDYLKGWPFNPVVDYKAKISANVTAARVPAGRCAHLNSTGQFELGASTTQMAIFLHQASDDADVSNDGGGNWYGIAPTGSMSGLVAVGALELQTTEYDTSVSYAPNDLLHSPTEAQITGATPKATQAGLLYRLKNWGGGGGGALTVYTDSVVGVVSAGDGLNANGRKVVSFWPVYLPGTST